MAGLVFLSLPQVGILAARGIEVNDFWVPQRVLAHIHLPQCIPATRQMLRRLSMTSNLGDQIQKIMSA